MKNDSISTLEHFIDHLDRRIVRYQQAINVVVAALVVQVLAQFVSTDAALLAGITIQAIAALYVLAYAFRVSPPLHRFLRSIGETVPGAPMLSVAAPPLFVTMTWPLMLLVINEDARRSFAEFLALSGTASLIAGLIAASVGLKGMRCARRVVQYLIDNPAARAELLAGRAHLAEPS